MAEPSHEDLKAFVAQMARMTTPYDGINPDDPDAQTLIDEVEDEMTGDFERDEALAFWDMIGEARKLFGIPAHEHHDVFPVKPEA